MATRGPEQIIEVASDGTVGLTPTYHAATSGGDELTNDGEMFVHVRNTHGSGTRTITFTPANTQFVDPDNGITTKAAIALVVAAGGDEFIGPFKPAAWNNANGRVAVTYSDSGANISFAVLTFNRDTTQ
tara:strand:- start:627 stop:1013 length:387 start_codon:yes stop_codon:yes gene_type:complete